MEQSAQGRTKSLTDVKGDRYALQSVAIAILAFGALWWYNGNLKQSVLWLTGISGFVSVFMLFVYRLEWYYLLLVGLIPISVDFAVAGDAKMNFPAEGLLAMAVPVLWLFNKRFRAALSEGLEHPLFKFMLLLIVVQFITGLLGNYVDVSLKRVFINFLFMTGFFGIIRMTEKGERLLWPFLMYAIGLIPVMYFTLMNHVHYDFDPRVVFSICQPYFNDHTVYGACLAFIIPLLCIAVFQANRLGFSNWMRMIFAVVLLVVIASEILALSRAALLSIVVALLFYVLLRYRVSFRALIAGLLLIGGVIAWFHEEIYDNVERNEAVSNDGELINHFSSVANVKSDASNLERINRWICAWRMFEDRPLTGFGAGTYQFEYNRYQTVANKTYISTNAGDRGNAHSEYLSALSESGIGGFVMWVLIVFGSIFFGMKNHYLVKDERLKRINLGVLLGLITYYFHAVFNAFLDQSKMAFLVYTSLGIIVWINMKITHESASKTEI